MYFMAVNRFKAEADAADRGKTIPLHIDWVKQQIAASKIVQAGKWGDTGGMAIIRADDPGEARALLDQDPLVRSGLITFELAPFYPDVPIS